MLLTYEKISESVASSWFLLESDKKKQMKVQKKDSSSILYPDIGKSVRLSWLMQLQVIGQYLEIVKTT